MRKLLCESNKSITLLFEVTVQLTKNLKALQKHGNSPLAVTPLIPV